MKLSILFATALAIVSSVISSPTPTRVALKKKWNQGFVTTSGKDFMLDGQVQKFPGVNAYWLFLLNEEQDIVDTLNQYKGEGIKVVRIWGFREAVGQAPAVGNFTQLWVNGKATCSQAGIARLKFILDTADSLGLKIQLALTNNWSVQFSPEQEQLFPPGYFSNSYGGLDTFAEQISPNSPRDIFYTKEEVKAAFKSWIDCIVTPFKDHKGVFSWELANDARCQGAQGTTTSSDCKTTTITQWSNEISTHVKSIDQNHLVGSGVSGFLCTQSTCPKINTPKPPAGPVPSGTPSKKKRWITSADVLARARRSERAARALRAVDNTVKRMKIRGGWSAPATVDAAIVKDKRQDSGTLGQAYNGFWGVDAEDICNSDTIDFCTIQVFPDQDNYSPTGSPNGRKRQSDSSPGATDQNVSDAVNFILNNAQDSSKPTAVLAAGITNQAQSNKLNNFNSNHVGSSSGQHVSSSSQQQTSTGKIAGTAGSVNSLMPWQQGHHGAHAKKGSVVQGSDSSARKRQSPTTGDTPDDGYAYFPGDPISNIWQQATNQQNGS